jgi:hypothetical protein
VDEWQWWVENGIVTLLVPEKAQNDAKDGLSVFDEER